MAFGWDDLAYLAISAYGSSQAGNAGKKSAQGGKNALAEQQRQYNIGLSMLEPQRALGYGALSDLAGLYGYALPQYTPLNALGGAAGGSTGNSNWTVGSPISVAGRQNPPTIAGFDANPFSGGARKFSGTIDPVAGTVDVNAKRTAKHDQFSNAATAYLRGEATDLKGKKLKRIRSAIDELKAQGWAWNAGQAPQTAGILPGGQTENAMSRFFASPDYNFRFDESRRGIEQSAANRGGLFSGDAAKDLGAHLGGLASGEFNNWRNSLFDMAGIGRGATTEAVNAGRSYANNASDLYQNIADNRASGVMGAANTMGQGLDNWLRYRYMRGGSNYQVPYDIQNFEYPFDRMGG